MQHNFRASVSVAGRASVSSVPSFHVYHTFSIIIDSGSAAAGVRSVTGRSQLTSWHRWQISRQQERAARPGNLLRRLSLHPTAPHVDGWIPIHDGVCSGHVHGFGQPHPGTHQLQWQQSLQIFAGGKHHHRYHKLSYTTPRSHDKYWVQVLRKWTKTF